MLNTSSIEGFYQKIVLYVGILTVVGFISFGTETVSPLSGLISLFSVWGIWISAENIRFVSVSLGGGILSVIAVGAHVFAAATVHQDTKGLSFETSDYLWTLLILFAGPIGVLAYILTREFLLPLKGTDR